MNILFLIKDLVIFTGSVVFIVFLLISTIFVLKTFLQKRWKMTVFDYFQAFLLFFIGLLVVLLVVDLFLSLFFRRWWEKMRGKPRIWLENGVWYCGRSRKSDIYFIFSGSTPELAFNTWKYFWEEDSEI